MRKLVSPAAETSLRSASLRLWSAPSQREHLQPLPPGSPPARTPQFQECPPGTKQPKKPSLEVLQGTVTCPWLFTQAPGDRQDLLEATEKPREDPRHGSLHLHAPWQTPSLCPDSCFLPTLAPGSKSHQGHELDHVPQTGGWDPGSQKGGRRADSCYRVVQPSWCIQCSRR